MPLFDRNRILTQLEQFIDEVPIGELQESSIDGLYFLRPEEDLNILLFTIPDALWFCVAYFKEITALIGEPDDMPEDKGVFILEAHRAQPSGMTHAYGLFETHDEALAAARRLVDLGIEEHCRVAKVWIADDEDENEMVVWERLDHVTVYDEGTPKGAAKYGDRFDAPVHAKPVTA